MKNDRHNVLVFTSGYGVSANGLCAEALVNELENKSAQVYVISFDTEEKKYDSEKVFSVYSPVGSKKAFKSFFLKVIYLLKNIVFYSLVPKYNKASVKKAVKLANDLCAQIDFDRVVSVYFPIESVVAGYELKKSFPKLKFMIYELDSVADGILVGTKFAGYIIGAYKKFLNRVYKYADLIMVHKSHENCWLREHNKHKNKLEIVDLPILCEQQNSECGQRGKDYRFLYGGTLDKNYRSPEILLEVFKKFENFDWSIDFYSKGCEEILEREESSKIRIHGYVSKAELNKAVAQTDFLLSIGNAVSNSLPSKVITYMTYGKPIIHFSLQEKDVCEGYLKKYPLAFIVEENTGIQDLEFFVKENIGESVSFESLREIFPMNLPSYSVELILK